MQSEYKASYNITFDKEGWMRYISHLDIMRLFTRAMRRAEFSLYFTKGFNPHPIVRIKKALKLGLTGKSQEAELILSEDISPEEFKQRLCEQLPAGINVRDVRL